MENLFQRMEYEPVQEIAFQDNTVWNRIKNELKKNKMAIVCLTILGIITILALLAPLSPYDPYQIDATKKLLPISAEHLLGTDEFGRDYLTRTLYGGRVSLIIGFCSMLMSIFLGVSIGVLSGYIGGKVDKIIMQLVNVFLSVPSILIMIVLNSFFKPSLATLICIISLFSWPSVARIVRSETVSVKERDYIVASRNLGVGTLKIATEHIVPNIMGSVIVAASNTVASAIIMESSLSFLGLGVQIPVASWGSMLQTAQINMIQYPRLVLGPGIMILLTVLSLNVLGDMLRNALDPKLTK